MVEVHRITDWRAPAAMSGLYEKLLGSMGTEEFGSTARDAVMSLTAGARRIYLFETAGRERGDLRYYTGEPGIGALIPLYNRLYLARDPVHDACRAAPRRSDMALLRIGPRDISESGYRRRFFDEAGIVERLSMVQRGADGWRVMNVARHESDGMFSDTELSGLAGLAGLLLPMLPMCRNAPELLRQPSVEQIEERFLRRCTALTLRERQVCARATIGMTVEATALDLGIGKTSVLTYRQRAYQRLRVTSSGELSSLVRH